METRAILSRLRSDAAGAPLGRLAALAVQSDLDTPLGSLVDSRFVARLVQKGLRAWLQSDAAADWLVERIHELRGWLAGRDETLETLLPPSLQEACIELAGHRYTPDRELTLFLLDREPVRKLLRDLFLDELVAFGRKLRAPVVENPLAKGLGGLGRFARDRARTSGGTLGALASDMVGAVSGELERQLERKAAEFADAALSRLLQRLVDLLCDPGSADDQAALRQALMEGVFQLETSELAHELERSEPKVSSEIVRRGLLAWLEGEGSEGELVEVIDFLLEPEAQEPLRALLERLELLESYVELAQEATLRRLRSLVETEAFGEWLEALLAVQEAGEELAPAKARTARGASKKPRSTSD